MDPHGRLRLGRRVQRVIENIPKVKEMDAVRIREAIMGHVEDAELAGWFASEIAPEVKG